jgi:hypothetical protein
MKQVFHLARIGLLLFVATALGACGNLQAVRDFSTQSAQLAAYKDVTNKVMSNPEALLQQAPPTSEFAPLRDKLKASGEARARRSDSLLKIHDVVTAYMGSLAMLAGEETYSLSSSISKVEGALVAAPDLGIKPETVSAFAKIASIVSNWITEAIQVKEVKAMVRKHGDSMDQMLAGMEDVTTSMLAILEEDQKTMASFAEYYEGGFRFPLGPEQPPPASLTGEARKQYEDQMNTARLRRDAALLLVSRSNAAMMSEQREAVTSAQAALAGVQIVRAGHTEMRKNVDRLTDEQVTAQLRRLAADLREVRTNLKKL